jgi:hypothetical protein
MILEIIDTRAKAEIEAVKEITQMRKTDPKAGARWRRKGARFVIEMCRKFRDNGDMELAVRHAMVARSHLIIARAWDREAAKRKAAK